MTSATGAAAKSTSVPKAPGPTAFKFKAGKGFKMGGLKMGKPSPPVGMFAQSGRESPEPEEAPPVVKPAMPRAGLAAGLAAATEPTAQETAKATGLAAAQAIADRISAALGVGGAVGCPATMDVSARQLRVPAVGVPC